MAGKRVVYIQFKLEIHKKCKMKCKTQPCFQ